MVHEFYLFPFARIEFHNFSFLFFKSPSLDHSLLATSPSLSTYTRFLNRTSQFVGLTKVTLSSFHSCSGCVSLICTILHISTRSFTVYHVAAILPVGGIKAYLKGSQKQKSTKKRKAITCASQA